MRSSGPAPSAARAPRSVSSLLRPPPKPAGVSGFASGPVGSGAGFSAVSGASSSSGSSRCSATGRSSTAWPSRRPAACTVSDPSTPTPTLRASIHSTPGPVSVHTAVLAPRTRCQPTCPASQVAPASARCPSSSAKAPRSGRRSVSIRWIAET